MLIIVGAGYWGILEDGKGVHFILSTLCMFEKFHSKVRKELIFFIQNDMT